MEGEGLARWRVGALGGWPSKAFIELTGRNVMTGQDLLARHDGKSGPPGTFFLCIFVYDLKSEKKRYASY
jgi:hypothetical protein